MFPIVANVLHASKMIKRERVIEAPFAERVRFAPTSLLKTGTVFLIFVDRYFRTRKIWWTDRSAHEKPKRTPDGLALKMGKTQLLLRRSLLCTEFSLVTYFINSHSVSVALESHFPTVFYRDCLRS
jgi:hypothetical protein